MFKRTEQTLQSTGTPFETVPARLLEMWVNFATMDAGEPLKRLLIRLMNPDHTESVDFWDDGPLEEQLGRFEARRKYRGKRRPDDLHTFSNRRGETLSFSDEQYVSHEVIDLRP